MASYAYSAHRESIFPRNLFSARIKRNVFHDLIINSNSEADGPHSRRVCLRDPETGNTSCELMHVLGHIQRWVANQRNTELKTNIDQWPVWNPGFWNRDEFRKVNNCYAYMLEDLKDMKERLHKPYPGERFGLPKLTRNDFNREELERRLRIDIPGIRFYDNFQLPGENYYLGALLIAPTPPMQDFHFVRMDQNCLWSHKPGGTAVTNVDADNHYIFDVKHANFNYDHDGTGTEFNYRFACYMHIPILPQLNQNTMQTEAMTANPHFLKNVDFAYHVERPSFKVTYSKNDVLPSQINERIVSYRDNL